MPSIFGNNQNQTQPLQLMGQSNVFGQNQNTMFGQQSMLNPMQNQSTVFTSPQGLPGSTSATLVFDQISSQSSPYFDMPGLRSSPPENKQRSTRPLNIKAALLEDTMAVKTNKPVYVKKERDHSFVGVVSCLKFLKNPSLDPSFYANM